MPAAVSCCRQRRNRLGNSRIVFARDDDDTFESGSHAAIVADA